MFDECGGSFKNEVGLWQDLVKEKYKITHEI
jgi:hypothetical protein